MQTFSLVKIFFFDIKDLFIEIYPIFIANKIRLIHAFKVISSSF